MTGWSKSRFSVMRRPSPRRSAAAASIRRLRLGEVVVAEGDVQQIDVPRQLDRARRRRSRRSRARSAASCPSSRRGRRGCRRASSFSYSSASSRANSSARERVARLDAGLGVVVGERRALVQPLPEDAQADLAGRHVLHQIEHVVVAEEVGRLERGGLQALAERVAVLQRDAEQIARAADGARRRLEQRSAPSASACV